MVEPLKKTDLQTLTEPDDEAKNRSRLIVQCIQQQCDAAGGHIPFSEYMNIVLYQPGLGYYSGGLQKFGASGDFVTAPEISPFFGQCLAFQTAEVLQNFDATSANQKTILEFGAGSGVLAVDILQQLEKLSTLPDQYLILELSLELQHRQQETIKSKVPHLYPRVQWLQQIPAQLNNVVIIANEVMDAMPVECFRLRDGAVETMQVSIEGEKPVAHYVADTLADKKIKIIEQRSELKFTDAYHSEYNPAVSAWLSALADTIDQAVILLIDYGYNEKEYYHPDRVAGTVMCYHQHKAHEDFFWWPGLQDITAFVNFTDLAYSAVDSGFDVSGYTTQAAFLLANGLSDLHATKVTSELQQQITLSQQIKTLTLPSEMGERFKVMALTKNYEQPLSGFSMLDLRNRL